MATMQFSSEPANTELPAGYFCSFDIKNDGADSWTVNFKENADITEKSQLIGYTYKHGKKLDKEGMMTFDSGHAPDASFRTAIKDGVLLTNPDDFEFSFVVINIFKRKLSDAMSFKIEIPHEYEVGGMGIVPIIVIAVVVVCAVLIMV